MSFSGDKPIVESILYDVSGSAISLTHSASVDMTTQAGVALAGVYSSSSGFTARVLQVDDEGRLMVDAQIVASGIQQVTGTVAISGPVTINQPVAVTDNGGSLTVDGTVTANVTGTVNLDRGNNSTFPLFITGSIDAIASGVQQVTGSVAISGPVTINQPVTVTGSVIANVTGTVNLDRGNSAASPLFISGTVGIGGPVSVTGSVALSGISVITGTVALENGYSELDPFWVSGSVAVNNVVRVDDMIHTTASGTFFANSTSAVTIAASSTSRRGLTIYNESNRAMYIKFGAGVTTTDYTYKIFSDDGWVMPDFLYSGIITAIWASSGNSGAQVTVITP